MLRPVVRARHADGIPVHRRGDIAEDLQILIGRREFAGYWEYVLDEALFTAPAHPQWGGSAVVGSDGRLLGIGSLLLQETVEGESASKPRCA